MYYIYSVHCTSEPNKSRIAFDEKGVPNLFARRLTLCLHV